MTSSVLVTLLLVVVYSTSLAEGFSVARHNAFCRGSRLSSLSASPSSFALQEITAQFRTLSSSSYPSLSTSFGVEKQKEINGYLNAIIADALEGGKSMGAGGGEKGVTGEYRLCWKTSLYDVFPDSTSEKTELKLKDSAPPEGSGSYVEWSNEGGVDKVVSKVKYEGGSSVGVNSEVGNVGVWKTAGVGSGWDKDDKGDEIDAITTFRTYTLDGTKLGFMGLKFGVPKFGGGGEGTDGYYGLTVVRGDLWIEWDGKGGIGGYIKV